MKAKEVTVRGAKFLLLPGRKEAPESWDVIDLVNNERVSFDAAQARAIRSPVWRNLCGHVLQACRRHRHPVNLLISTHGVEHTAQLLGCTPSRVCRLRMYGSVLTLQELARAEGKIDIPELLLQTRQEAAYPSIRSE